jgi:hypothetical protein
MPTHRLPDSNAKKCQDIGYPMVLKIILSIIFMLRYEQKIIMCENGLLIMLVGAHDDFSAAH